MKKIPTFDEFINEKSVANQKPVKGDWVEVRIGHGKDDILYITYIDDTHVSLSYIPNIAGKTGRGSIKHIGQLSTQSYYEDMEKWMETGDATISNNQY